MKNDTKNNPDLMRALNDLDRHLAKLYDRLFQPIDPSTPHLTLLQSLTKNELDDIRRFWKFKGLSTLKKADLAKELAPRISANLKHWLVRLDQKRFQLLTDLIANDGILFEPDLEISQIRYFRERGILFTGLVNDTKALILPQELIPLIRELLTQDEIIKQIQTTDEFLRLTKGLITYYGVVPILDLYDLVNDLTNLDLKSWEYIPILYDWAEFDLDVIIDESILHSMMVDDPQWILSEQTDRPWLDYYPLTRQQALAAGKRGFFEPTLTQKRFIKYLLHNWEMTQEVAEMIVKELIISINNSSQITPIEHIELLQEFIEINTLEEMREVTDYIVNLHNNTPSWSLKGHAPNQISGRPSPNLSPLPTQFKPEPEENEKPQPIVKDPKIGRNEPCPCGSGKKYKKCCGR